MFTLIIEKCTLLFFEIRLLDIISQKEIIKIRVYFFVLCLRL